MTEALRRAISCQVCNKQKAPGDITSRESRLLKGVSLFICSKCEAGKKEPRGFIIIVAHTGDAGLKKVRPYLKGKLYEGPEITGKELLK